jgi:hypothetical protein
LCKISGLIWWNLFLRDFESFSSPPNSFVSDTIFLNSWVSEVSRFGNSCVELVTTSLVVPVPLTVLMTMLVWGSCWSIMLSVDVLLVSCCDLHQCSYTHHLSAQTRQHSAINISTPQYPIVSQHLDLLRCRWLSVHKLERASQFLMVGMVGMEKSWKVLVVFRANFKEEILSVGMVSAFLRIKRPMRKRHWYGWNFKLHFHCFSTQPLCFLNWMSLFVGILWRQS